MTAKFEPTDEERALVEQMTAVGIPQGSVALIIRDGIDNKTLRKHFRVELDTAKIKANAKIGGMLFNKAMNGDTTAAIFWAKTQMGWKETQNINHSGKLDVIERVIIPANEQANDTDG
jgi:hypothetical protein|tara:strand:- start:3547 stop:3900 length:354 start_codon:yes stop_codon:yes gene_type:complete